MRYALLLLSVSLLTLCTACGKKPQAAPVKMSREVTVVPATMGKVRPYQESIAEVVAMNTVDLVARVEGFLVKRNFVEGQPVKKGDVLFEIEDVIYKAQLEVERGNLMTAIADLENKKIDLKRQEVLLKQDATTQQDYDHAKSAVEQAEGALESQKGQVKLAEQNVYYTKVYAPFDALTGFVTYSDGNLVNAQSGKLVTLTSTGDVRVRFSVPEVSLLSMFKSAETSKADTESLRNAIRDVIRVRLILPNRQYYDHEGVLEFFSNQISRSTATFSSEAVFPNPESALIDGMNVNVMLERKEPVDALLIPERAISKTQAGDRVIVVDSANVTDLRIIKTGLVYDTLIEVKSGLKPGERVITEGILRASQRGLTVTPMVDINPAATFTDTPRKK